MFYIQGINLFWIQRTQIKSIQLKNILSHPSSQKIFGPTLVETTASNQAAHSTISTPFCTLFISLPSHTACSSILKNRGSRLLEKCWYLSTRHPGTQQTSYSQPRKPQISQFHSIFYIVTNVMCIMTFFIKKYGKLVVLHYPCCYSECNICLKSIEMLLWIINFHLQVLGIQTKF